MSVIDPTNARLRVSPPILLDGEYDLQRTDELRAALLESSDAELVVVDMTTVTFIDSSAIRVFVEARNKLADTDRQLVLHSLGAAPRRVFEITGLVDVFGL